MAFAISVPLPSLHPRPTPVCRTRPSATLDNALTALKAHPLPTPSATVYLVGTGPGDPSLLTLRAVDLMRRADIVLYDRLVSDDILDYVNPAAKMLYVGKQSGYHTRSQDEIHLLLAAFAQKGSLVVRLKGGDPFVFGRGGEETDFLERAGIAVRAVPGITAASGIGAELGIPLTHRGVASSVRFITGHLREGEVGEVEIGHVCDTTLVVYMGLGGLKGILERFVEAGVGVDVPAVAVERGTLSDQRVVWETVGGLEEKVREVGLVSPTLIIVGEVVALARGWQALFGVREEVVVQM